MYDQAELFADMPESYLIDPHGSGRSTSPHDASAYSPEQVVGCVAPASGVGAGTATAAART
jgi:hypothetical protein